MTNPIPLTKDEDFQAALRGEDELGLVVRAHIYIEANLLELLTNFVGSQKHIDKMNLEYSQRVHLAIALGLKDEYESPLLTLGTLRNAFAHRPGTKLSKDRVDALYSSLSPATKEIVQNSHQSARRKMPEAKVPAFSRLSPRDQFILIAVALRALLQMAIKEAKALHASA
jgi:hypothetical protein